MYFPHSIRVWISRLNLSPALAGICLLTFTTLSVLGAEGGERTGAAPRFQAIPRAEFRELRKGWSSDRLQLLEKINRMDAWHLNRAEIVVIPDDFERAADHSPFPSFIQELEKVPKILLVSLPVQAFAGYENGRLVRWGPVNTGYEKQETPANLYFANWRAPRRASNINRNWIMRWYFNIHTAMGIALHQYEMPGRPVSYGCIRLLQSDARWFYDWASEWVPDESYRTPRAYGTPVAVFGRYNYSADPPWTRLAEDPDADRVPEDVLAETLERYLWVILERIRQRQELLTGHDVRSLDRQRSDPSASTGVRPGVDREWVHDAPLDPDRPASGGSCRHELGRRRPGQAALAVARLQDEGRRNATPSSTVTTGCSYQPVATRIRCSRAPMASSDASGTISTIPGGSGRSSDSGGMRTSGGAAAITNPGRAMTTTA